MEPFILCVFYTFWSHECARGHAESKLHLSLHQDELRTFKLKQNEARNNVSMPMPKKKSQSRMLKHKIELLAFWRMTQEGYEFEISVGCIGYIQKWGRKQGDRKTGTLNIFCGD